MNNNSSNNYPNYLFKYILESILVYLSDKKSISYYGSNFKNNNEIINYSLVSKLWFDMLSKILTQLLNHKNSYSFHGLIDFAFDDENIGGLVYSENKFKIIKLVNQNHQLINNITLNGVFLDEVYQIKQNLSSKPSVLIFSLNHEMSDKIIRSLKLYPDNFKFNLVVSSNISNYNLLISQYNDNDKHQLKKINKIVINDGNDRMGLFNLIRNDISNIELEENRNNTSNYYLELKFKTNENQKINIDDMVFPYQLKRTLNDKQSIGKLKKFRYHTKLSKLLNIIKTNSLSLFDVQLDDHYRDNFNKESWDHLVSKLSNDITLKRISFIDVNEPIFKNIDKVHLYNGFKTILSSQSNKNFKTFSFKCLSGDIHPLILEGISLNKSISNLYINDIHLISILKHSLLNNKSIKNLYINQISENVHIIIDALKLLSNQYYNDIVLYSITIDVKESMGNFQSLIQLVQSLDFNIKEFNITNKYHPLLSSKNKSYQIVSNNIIYNISFEI